MIRDPKLALAVLAGLVVLLVAFRDVLPPKWVKPASTLAGALGATVHGLAAGAPLADTLEHVAMLSIAGLAAGGLAPGPRETAPPTPRTPREPPALPILVIFAIGAAVIACTPGERKAADSAAKAAVPACMAGMLIAEAPELEPLCAELPEIVDAVAELVHEGQPATRSAVHRRVLARRQGGHRP